MDLMNLIKGQMGAMISNQVAQKFGINNKVAKVAIAAVVPVLVARLFKNSKDEKGANALAGALERDHDGSILDNLGSFFGGGKVDAPRPSALDGEKILGHIFGEDRPKVEQALSKDTGLREDFLGQIMNQMAPVVLGTLGKQKKEQGLDIGGLVSMLGGARESLVKDEETETSLLSKVLDRDGDGNMMDDIGSLLGGLF